MVVLFQGIVLFQKKKKKREKKSFLLPSLPRLLEEGNVEEAEVQKQRIEQLQRERRRVLEENSVEHQPRFFRFVPGGVGGGGQPCGTNGSFCVAIAVRKQGLSHCLPCSFLVPPCSRREGHCQSWSQHPAALLHLQLGLAAGVDRFYVMTG